MEIAGNWIQISTLVNEGRLKPIIAEVFSLARAREAFEYGAGTHSPGKIILEVTAR
jgi:NADPH:quinone reductase-like Zn-dependent oxidoreductase